VERIPPPPAIAQRPKLDPQRDTCVVRRHIRYIDNKPAIISDDYFDEQIVRGTELAEPEDTTREDILKEAGYEQIYDVDEIITRMPTPDEIKRLNISPGTRRLPSTSERGTRHLTRQYASWCPLCPVTR
jgi:DNA-binding GntR family transcriptional regulator